jgi:hypothetical protein
MAASEKTVRFSKLVEEFGKPALYLPLADPNKDPKFLEAAKENRVLTIKQDPTSKQKDFGIVDFLREKFVTYLIFPKSLEPFANARVVGIKYDELSDTTIAPPPSAIEPKPKKPARPAIAEANPEPKPRIKPEPKPKPEPQPKNFIVRVQVTATACTEQDISVTAMTRAEAQAKAKEQAASTELPKSDLKFKILKVREAS